jgi:predicted RNA-binding protein with RPS1 domain
LLNRSSLSLRAFEVEKKGKASLSLKKNATERTNEDKCNPEASCQTTSLIAGPV